MYQTVILLFTLLFWNTILAGQDSLGIPEWINSRRQMLGLDDAGLTTDAFRASWIREMEFRTETEDFEPGKQEYLFRFSPSTPRIRRAQSRLIELARQEVTLDQTDFRAEVMKYILDELLEIRNIVASLELQRRLLAVYEDEQQLISKMLAEKAYNIKDLLQIESDIQKITLNIKNNEYQKQLLSDNKMLPATGQLISIAAIAAQLEMVDWEFLDGPDQSKDQLDADRLDTEIQLEKAEKNRFIDFIQLRYNGPHTDILGERLALGIGIDLPFSSSKKMKLEELRVEQLALDQEIRHRGKMDSLKVLESLLKLRAQIDKWKLVSENLENQENRLKALSEKGMDIAYDAPDIFLFQQEAILKIRQDRLDLEDDIYKSYFDLLEQTGILWNDGQSQDILNYILE